MTIRRFLSVPLLLCAALAFGCRGAVLPETADEAGTVPAIWPDYADVTIPVNLAPTNFLIKQEGEAFVTQIRGANRLSAVVAGKTVRMKEAFWKKLLAENAGGEIVFTVYVKNDGRWTVFEPFSCRVCADRIDPFVAYRLIEPGYEFYRRITLNTRSLESFDEQIFVDNDVTNKKTCVNCHSFQNRETDHFLFHARRAFGGTILVQDGKPTKLGTKSPSLNLPAVYPSWHPTLPLIAFSSNRTKQLFHSIDPDRIDVLDLYSDLTLYDVAANRFTPFPETRTVYETFPSWSPDGKTLFYCAADLVLGEPADSMPLEEMYESGAHGKVYNQFRYNIMKMSFDPQTRKFGKAETVVDAAAENHTALHPRLSIDGRYLVYTKADFGTFPIWHRESDLWLLDMETGAERAIDEINSPDVESWHTWSSTGRWMVFSSRRDDGAYTRLYFAHFDENGRFAKPFLLPQKNPEENITRMKSYNVPEFITEAIPVSAGTLGTVIRYADEVPASFDSTITPGAETANEPDADALNQ